MSAWATRAAQDYEPHDSWIVAPGSLVYVVAPCGHTGRGWARGDDSLPVLDH
jgi:hypothetical protein